MKKLEKMLSKKNVSAIRKHVSKYPYAEISEIMEGLKNPNKVILLKSLKTEDQAEVFSFLSPKSQEAIIKTFSSAQIEKLLNSLFTEDAVDFIEDLPIELSNKILQQLSPEKRKVIKKILNYDEDQVGSIMSIDIFYIKQSWTVGDVIKEIKNKIDDVHFSKNLYVVDSKTRLTGYIKIKDIIFETKKKSIKSFLKPVTFVNTTTDVEEAANIFVKHEMESLPVIDSQKKLVGMIASDEVIEVINEEVREDFQVMAGIQASETPYSEVSISKLFKSRVLWLLLLMISATLSQVVLDAFLDLANKNLNTSLQIATAGITSAMVAILPVISGAAGNAGSQSSTTVIRALATGDIDQKGYLKVFGKELRTSSLIGFSLAIVNFIRLIIYYSIKGDIHNIEFVALSGAASLSLLIVIMLSQIVGGLLPLFAKLIKIDPAVMAAPLLTTIIDALSTAIFFAISIGIMILII